MHMTPSIQSALVVLVPEADALVKPFRDQYDPSAAQGAPAHFTILVPFKPPQDLTASVIDTLRDIFAQVAPFTVALTEVRRFPQTLYLAPIPDQPLKHLTQLVVDRFPEHPPYGGAFTEIIPHLTIAHLDDPQRLTTIAADFQRVAHDHLPLSIGVTEVVLLDNATGRWQVRTTFRLGTS